MAGSVAFTALLSTATPSETASAASVAATARLGTLPGEMARLITLVARAA